MKKNITLKDIEDCIREIISKDEDITIEDDYIYIINSNVIKLKTKRSKNKQNK